MTMHPEIRAALDTLVTYAEEPDDDDVYARCPQCKRWQLSDGLLVPICNCGYCAHMSLTGDVCNWCGETKAEIALRKTQRVQMVDADGRKR